MSDSNSSSFDTEAYQYDSNFTHLEIGKLQRNRVYDWLEKIHFFATPKNVFEINCGTGYDAEKFHKKGHHVIATDGSMKMIEYAKTNRNREINFYQLDFKTVSNDENIKQSEVVFSNFGGLNCLSGNELKTFLGSLASIQNKNDLFIGVFMSKFCFVEDLYHFLKFKWQKIGRRNTDEVTVIEVNEVGVNTYYHSPLEVEHTLKNDYNIKLKKPIAFFLPPSYLEPFFKKHRGLLKVLNNLEQFFGRLSFLSSWADHYIIIAERK